MAGFDLTVVSRLAALNRSLLSTCNWPKAVHSDARATECLSAVPITGKVT
jgi:hypothetical protein